MLLKIHFSNRYELASGVLRHSIFTVFIFLFLFHVPAFSQCIYGNGGCTFTQTANNDTCPGSPPNPNYNSINQFYAYGGSGVSVLYCGGVNTNPNTSLTGTTISLAGCTFPAGATIQAAYLEIVENSGSNTYSTAPVSVAGGSAGAGVLVGQSNFANAWIDPPIWIGWGMVFHSVLFQYPLQRHQFSFNRFHCLRDQLCGHRRRRRHPL